MLYGKDYDIQDANQKPTYFKCSDLAKYLTRQANPGKHLCLFPTCVEGHGRAAHQDGYLAESHPQELCGPGHLPSHWIFIFITLNINTVSRDPEVSGSQTCFLWMHRAEMGHVWGALKY